MSHKDARNLVENAVGDRLRALLGDRTIGNGMPVAAALATALSVDVRLKAPPSGAPRHLAALTDMEIIDLADRLIIVVEKACGEFDLPFGSRVEDWFHTVRIDKERWGLKAGKPGLVPLGGVSYAVTGPNLDLLREHVERLTQDLPCRALGLPMSFCRTEESSDSYVQFPPCVEAGGIVLIYEYVYASLPFVSAPSSEIVRLADELVNVMDSVWQRRHAFAEISGRIGPLAEKVAHRLGTTVSMITVDCSSPGENGDEFEMEVAYEGLDDALRPGRTFESVFDPESPRLDGRQLEERRRQLADLQKHGANGRIDTLARSVLSASHRGLQADLARLAVEVEIHVLIPVGRTFLSAQVDWWNGVITATAWIDGHLDIHPEFAQIPDTRLPDTILHGVVGSRIDRMIELPFACEITISHAKQCFDHSDYVWLDLRQGPDWLVNTETGMIWPEG